jgi:hypothetical protein
LIPPFAVLSAHFLPLKHSLQVHRLGIRILPF